MAKVLEGLYYTESHEYVKVEGNIGYVGITDWVMWFMWICPMWTMR